MVIDDDDVTLHRLAPHFSDEAAVKLAAFLADAGIGAGIQLVPEQAGFRQLSQLSPVAGAGRLFPSGNGAVLLDLFQSAQHRLIREVVKLLAAQIIVSTLHVTDREPGRRARSQRLFEKRDVFVKELLLQVFCAGRDDDAFAGADYRQEISQRLAGAGPGLNHQVALFFEGLLDGLSHLKLAAAEFIGGVRAGEKPAGSEELMKRGDFPAVCRSSRWRRRRGLRGSRHGSLYNTSS